ncbi:hypothetical protein DFAR_2610006 [Desulfarculales bacterium]
MDRETMEQAFSLFFTTKPAGKGTGLGLAMVQRIMKGHGGAITCISIPGQCTIFLYWPIAAEAFYDTSFPSDRWDIA